MLLRAHKSLNLLQRLVLVLLAAPLSQAQSSVASLRGRILQQSFPNYDISNILVDDTQVVSASGASVLSVDVSDGGGLEASGQYVDYLQVCSNISSRSDEPSSSSCNFRRASKVAQDHAFRYWTVRPRRRRLQSIS